MQDFKKIQVWQKAHTLTLDIYKATSTYPSHELYGLVSQIRRAASSIATNIAEGCGRNTNPDFHRFLVIASGSASEVEYLFMLSKDLGYLSEEQFMFFEERVTEIKRMLSSLQKKVKNKLTKSPKEQQLTEN